MHQHSTHTTRLLVPNTHRLLAIYSRPKHSQQLMPAHYKVCFETDNKHTPEQKKNQKKKTCHLHRALRAGKFGPKTPTSTEIRRFLRRVSNSLPPVPGSVVVLGGHGCLYVAGKWRERLQTTGALPSSGSECGTRNLRCPSRAIPPSAPGRAEAAAFTDARTSDAQHDHAKQTAN